MKCATLSAWGKVGGSPLVENELAVKINAAQAIGGSQYLIFIIRKDYVMDPEGIVNSAKLVFLVFTCSSNIG